MIYFSQIKEVNEQMKILHVVLIILVVLSITMVSYAEKSATNLTPANKSGATVEKKYTTDALQHKPGMKAERGIKNILFGWTDIPRSIIQVTRDSKNPIWGITGGTLKGVGKAFPRTISGIADVISFPIADYDKMPIKPDELKTQIQ